ncbi:MAG TPA: DEAD/DEAH box helicase [Pirellulales bacterium]|jgi:SNF2 family DNA or RNA helicase|nr:DEAD/DEAH box helicase [Pirellulales bacterium]
METHQTDLTIPLSLFNTGWQAGLARGSKIKVLSAQLTGAPPGVVSLPIRPKALKLGVRSFAFDRAQSTTAAATASGVYRAARPVLNATAAGASPSSSLKPQASSLSRPTRIKPPRDTIRLEDRLFYCLQPPLETLLAGDSLDFPFHPFPYQFEGVAFLYPREAAILADEMGLGKTMQAITAMRVLLRAGEIETVLLVCPKPLVTNWLREFALWAPELPVTAIEGDQARRSWQWQLSDTPIKIANYELLQRDAQTLAPGLLRFDLVVLDEAQRIKNRAGHTSQAVRQIGRRRSWALTGTPVENSPEDLVGIFEFLAPGHLTSGMKPRRMGQAAGDYILRRTKDKVLTELPPKMFRDAEIELTSQQRETYQMAEEEGVLRLTELGEGATIQHVFELVLRLKQICNFDPATGQSAKLERLSADLEEVAASGRKAIIFSQWVDTLQHLARRLSDYRPLEYHGRIASRERDAVIERFRDDPDRHVLLISYGAGGVGLNLQFAGYVFLFDRWWNPAVEDQAVNRAHRIGAAGPVTVTRFLTLSTIEERIDQILRDKRELFDTIFSDVARRHMGLSQSEIFGLFRLRCPHGPIDMAA